MTPLTDVDDFLAHHGVKGMRWGKSKGSSVSRSEKRKAANAPNAGYSNQQRTIDEGLVGSVGTKYVNRRMNKGQTHSKAFGTVAAKQLALGVAVTAAFMVGPGGSERLNTSISNAAKSAVTKKKLANGAKAAATLLSDSHGLTSYVTIVQ